MPHSKDTFSVDVRPGFGTGRPFITFTAFGERKSINIEEADHMLKELQDGIERYHSLQGCQICPHCKEVIES